MNVVDVATGRQLDLLLPLCLLGIWQATSAGRQHTSALTARTGAAHAQNNHRSTEPTANATPAVGYKA